MWPVERSIYGILVTLRLSQQVAGSLEDRLLPTSHGAARLAQLGFASPPPPLPWQARVRILRDTLRALAYLHRASPQVLHRDVKASNILLDAAGVAQLSDVGLAKEAAPDAAQNQTHMSTLNGFGKGTPGYLDPLISQGMQPQGREPGWARRPRAARCRAHPGCGRGARHAGPSLRGGRHYDGAFGRPARADLLRLHQ
jgi:serine/threonine protein kinase